RVGGLMRHASRTTVIMKQASSSAASWSPASGLILSQTTLRAMGLPADTEVGLFFVTARGNRMGPSGWNLDSIPLANAKTKPDGSLTASIRIPDHLGCWDVVKVEVRRRVME